MIWNAFATRLLEQCIGTQRGLAGTRRLRPLDQSGETVLGNQTRREHGDARVQISIMGARHR